MSHPSRASRFRLGLTLALTSLPFFMVGLDALIFGVGNAQVVAHAPSSPDLGAAPALSTVRAYDPSTEAREPGTAVHTHGGAR